MREIETNLITKTVAQLCLQAAATLPKDVENALASAYKQESWPPAQEVLLSLQKNIKAADEQHLPLCQDTGMVCVFVELGQEALLLGGGLYDAIQAGVREGYQDNFLRKSVVADPLLRTNTGDNTPAIIHTEIVAGQNIKLTVLPKGFGSENMSRLAMLTPSAGEDGVKDFILDTVAKAGANPCPPIVLGVGIGGSFDSVALAAKKSLLRTIGSKHENPFYAEMEKELLEKVNKIGIGPAGYGGRTTALAVHILAQPTHIAGLPVAVNISCHALRRATAVL